MNGETTQRRPEPMNGTTLLYAPGSTGHLSEGTIPFLRRRGKTSNRIDLSRIPEDHWQIDFSSGAPVFTRFTREEAAERIRDLGQTLQTARVALGEHIDWGDLDHSLPHVEGRCFYASLSAAKPRLQSDSRIERCTCVSARGGHGAAQKSGTANLDEARGRSAFTS